ncbi:MAG: hypothetical protein WD069_00910 [Planctomycetales bacterium]
MSFRQDNRKSIEWKRWVDRHRPELIECGLHEDAWRTRMDWFLFLDHGYIQTVEIDMRDWWRVGMLAGSQCERFARFLEREYGTEYSWLVEKLRRLAVDKEVV